MSKLKALLFDVDGTLVDTEELHRQAFNQAFLEFGLDLNWSGDVYAELLTVSGGVDRIARYIDWLRRPAAEKTRLRRLIRSIHREKTRIYGMLIGSNGVRLRAGLSRLLDEAHGAGLKIGLAATSALANVHGLLAATLSPSQNDAIAEVVCASQVDRKKPAPDLYELLLTQLRLPAEACVAFEDSANGVAAAKAAGLFVVATPSRWTRGHDFGGADLVLDSLGDPDQPLSASDAARIDDAPYLRLAHIVSLREGHAIRRPADASA